VTNVFDLKDRHGLLATGQMQGRVRPGMTLQDSRNRTVRVLGLEFRSPRDIATGEVTILLERTQPSPVRPDVILTETPPG